MREKRYFIQVQGFDGQIVTAASASKARYSEWLKWREAGYGRTWPRTITFIEFVRDRIEVFHHLGALSDQQVKL